MKRTRLWIALFLLAGVAAAQEAEFSLEPNVNRFGMDYRDMFLPRADPELCRKACAGDPRCKAFTYVKPRGPRARARCWLKEGVPAPTQSGCCVSGVRAQATASEDEVRWEAVPEVPGAGLALFSQPVPRGKAIETLLAEPDTAKQLRDLPALQDRKAVDLATASLAGEGVKGEPQTAGGGLTELQMIELDWEAGVQFTPRHRWGQLAVDGMYLPGNKSLAQLYDADQLYLHAKGAIIHWSSAVHPGPGTYTLVLQIRMPKANANWLRIYVSETGASGDTMRQVSPKSHLFNPDTPDDYVDGIATLLTLYESGGLKLLIKTSESMFLDSAPAVFAGFTITRL